MADVGRPVKEIEITPEQWPEPAPDPVKEPEPLKQPEKV